MNEDEYIDLAWDLAWEDRISGYDYEREPDMYDYDYQEHQELLGRYRDTMDFDEDFEDYEDSQDFA